MCKSLNKCYMMMIEYTYIKTSVEETLRKPNRWRDWLISTNFITNAWNNNLQRNLLGAMYVSTHHHSHVDQTAHSHSHFLIYSFSFFLPLSVFLYLFSCVRTRHNVHFFCSFSLSLSPFGLASRTYIEQHMQTYAAIY